MAKLVQLIERIPASESDPLDTLKKGYRHRQSSFSLSPVSPEEVKKIIAVLKNTKSTGMDYIDTWVIKLVAAELLPALTHVVNLSISNHEFPLSWKMSTTAEKGGSFAAKEL